MDDDFDDDQTVETFVSRRREGDIPPGPASRASGGGSLGDGFDHGPKVLWGRVVALFVVLLFVFLLGRGCAPDGVPQARLDDVQQELAETKAALEEERKATPTPQATFPVISPTPTPGVSASPTATGAAKTQTYTVKAGDTLRGISLKFYGTTAHAKVIQDANQISDAGALTVGKKLTIPPKPSPSPAATATSPTTSD